VTFSANTGTGKFVNVDNVDDLAIQVTGRDGNSVGSVSLPVSSANQDTIKLRVIMRQASNGTTDDRPFSVQFYARTTN